MTTPCARRILVQVNDGKDGRPGRPGIPGVAGAAGPQGIQGVPGPKGDVGPTGPQGDKGDTGPKGDAGPQGIPGVPGPVGSSLSLIPLSAPDPLTISSLNFQPVNMATLGFGNGKVISVGGSPNYTANVANVLCNSFMIPTDITVVKLAAHLKLTENFVNTNFVMQMNAALWKWDNPGKNNNTFSVISGTKFVFGIIDSGDFQPIAGSNYFGVSSDLSVLITAPTRLIFGVYLTSSIGQNQRNMTCIMSGGIKMVVA